jgi:hypothetical protein
MEEEGDSLGSELNGLSLDQLTCLCRQIQFQKIIRHRTMRHAYCRLHGCAGSAFAKAMADDVDSSPGHEAEYVELYMVIQKCVPFLIPHKKI